MLLVDRHLTSQVIDALRIRASQLSRGLPIPWELPETSENFRFQFRKHFADLAE